MASVRAEISVSGLVQGVGFRPFCYRLATRYGLKGFVRNTGDAGVQIILEGEREAIEKFIAALKSERPPLSKIEEVKAEAGLATGEFREFTVEKSGGVAKAQISVVPPDIALCDDCLREMLDPKNRRYRYPFITCVNCGPRFTIIEDIPYDRERTSMREFPLCPDCLREYTDTADRRYHAEPTCCAVQGPRLKLYHSSGEVHEVDDPLSETSKLLDEGKVVVIKGIGGMHVAAKTTEDEPLRRLRDAFGRPQQPFAVMVRDLETIRTFAEAGPIEGELLKSPQRPIVALRRSKGYNLSELVSPGLDSVGAMLPYSGIHHLILREGREPAYVMTSANLPGLPMVVENREAIRELGGRVDYLLLHDRRIVNRCDDSVMRITDGEPVFLRRSRGYVPMPLELNISRELRMVAIGAEVDAAAAVVKGGRCFLTQHLGDLGKVETVDFLRSAVRRMMHLNKLDGIDVVACDLHPQYSTTSEAEAMAKEFGAKLTKVQHHHAHLVSLMAERGVEELVGIDADGIGYGADGTLWGGEVMAASPADFKRTGSLAVQPMPGGDLATRFPARMVAGILWDEMEPAVVEKVLRKHCMAGFGRGEAELKAVISQLEKDINVPRTSSCGRVLDAISCLLGVCRERTYEGEPAIKLEAVARGGDPERAGLRCEIRREGGVERLDTSKLLMDVARSLESRVPVKDIAAGAQRALAVGMAEMATEAANAEGMRTVGVTGGVFFNDVLTRFARETVVKEGLEFLRHRILPPGDGGIAVGQAFSAARRFSV